MDIKQIKELIKTFEESTLDELELEDKNGSIRLAKNRGTSYVAAPPQPVAVSAPAAPPAVEDNKGSTKESSDDATATKGEAVTSPMVGTFYRSPSPDAKPFVEIGDTVSSGDVICIIEAMKTMNKIKSTGSGVVKQILLDDGSPVEYGQKMLILE